MINRIIAIAMLFAMISANLSRFLIYAQFKANQEEIAAKLCENRNRPELNCRGKCILMKKLKEAEQKEKKQEQESMKKSGVDVFVVTEPILLSFRRNIPQNHWPLVNVFELAGFHMDILHPPAQLS